MAARAARGVLLILAVTLGSHTVQANDGPLKPCIDASEAQRAVAMINEWRERGAPCTPSAMARKTLHWVPTLTATATAHASDLAQRDTLSHEDAQRRGLAKRLELAGYSALHAAENVAAGQQTFPEALAAWLKSPQHCTTLMTPGYSEVGLACIERRGTRYERFWVAQLGSPQTR